MLTPEHRQCLSELFRASHWNAMPTWERDMIADARAAKTKLSNDGRFGYIFLIDGRGWCGSAGCTLLIGERDANGGCRLLFSGSGWYSARVLPQRDHGYHRLYLPCEVRFDGKEYQQLREECPNVNVIH